MLHTLSVLEAAGTDPRRNLAIEETLLRRVQSGCAVLYLWQNQNTVVIGRNQNAENECKIQALEADGGILVRRLSGGGAVYHDLGNLNFTFCVPMEDFDVGRQTEVILQAVRSLGIKAEKNGRNDLTAEGCKFSGHSYYKTGNRGFHNGTLMVEVDKSLLERYLTVSPLKLKAKGVASVRSRVVNLKELKPDLTVTVLKAALVNAFGEVYGLPVHRMEEASLDTAVLADCLAQFSSPRWTYGSSRPLDYSREARFDWGTVRLDYSLKGDTISEAALWSDGLDAEGLSQIPALLKGAVPSSPMLAERLETVLSPDMAGDILSLLHPSEKETPSPFACSIIKK